MNIIDLYVTEVGKHLPRKKRADLMQEIHSLIDDAADDAAREQGVERSEALEMEVLKKFGAPAQLAASYDKPAYLIGPRMYPFFWLVLRIVLAVVLAVTAVGIGIGFGQDAAGSQGPVQAVAEAVARLLGALVSTFGNVVLVFVILERFLPEKDIPFDEWDPSELKAEPDPQQVSMWEPILETVFTTALLVLLNFYPQWIGLFSFVDGRWVSVPFLSPAFFSYVPFISVLLVVEIIQNGLLLRSGRWTTGLRWYEVATDVASIVLLGWMLSGPSLLQINTAGLAELGWNADFGNTISNAGPALEKLFRLALGIALAVNVVEVASNVYRLLTHKDKFSFKLPQ